MTGWNEPGRELLDRRGGLLEPEQALRRHHDERPRRRVERLAAEQVEELARGRAVGDPDVVLRALLEEPLEPRARVLGPVALVAVRQQQRQARRLPPLRAAGDEELVDHDLGAVDEVAELRLPEDERVRRGDRVAVLEPERRVLRERRVVDLERRVRRREVLDRRVRLARCTGRGRRGGGARTCRARRPGRRAGPGCRPRAASRTRAPRPGPSRCRPPRSSRGGARAAWPASR